MLSEDQNIDKVLTVRAGKFRRYNSEGLKQLLDVATLFKNIRDLIFVCIGLVQSYLILRKLSPRVVFSRGGYVSVPVCLGAKLRGISYITHESDPIPSLTNKIIGPWAKLHLVSQAKELYPYSKDTTVETGIPVSRLFVPITASIREEYRQKLNIRIEDQMIFIIGGGLGAQSLNEAMINILPNLLAEFKNLMVTHVVGHKNEQQVLEAYDKVLDKNQRQRVKVLAFTDQVYLYSGSSDIVITRAGATNLAEFEVQGLACIVIPSTYLASGHQLKNAQLLSDHNAALVINDKQIEDNPYLLAKEIRLLLKDHNKRQKLAKALSKLAHFRAAEVIADLIIKTAEEVNNAA